MLLDDMIERLKEIRETTGNVECLIQCDHGQTPEITPGPIKTYYIGPEDGYVNTLHEDDLLEYDHEDIKIGVLL